MTRIDTKLLNKYSHYDFEELIATDSDISTTFCVYPCNSRAVEKCVKLVTEASKVAGENALVQLNEKL